MKSLGRLTGGHTLVAAYGERLPFFSPLLLLPGLFRELAEEPGHNEHRLLGDIDGVASDPLQAARNQDHVHRPLADREVVADVDRARDDVAV